MTAVLQVGSQTIQAEEMLPLLQRYQVLPQVLRGLIIDQAIAEFSCSPEEQKQALALFDQHHQLTSEQARETWLLQHRMTLAQYTELATRPLLIEKFKQLKWGHMVEPYFLKRKRDLDQVIYSLIRTKDFGLANELYFRILEGEQAFEMLAEQYSQGLEANTGGLLGPVPIQQTHPAIAKLLMVSKPGKLWSPCVVGEWVVIIRLEKLIPAQLDEPMHRRMVDELFESWVQEQIQPPMP
uniref:peptidylprolyl isomerase n=1 Tax=Oscillatoriales cyanobacterium SpSt-402 TaxID=2282168 RepID=A0A832M3D0_9CYAN